jgi:hypothetical protein
MSRLSGSNLKRFAIPFLAAALAVGVTAPVVADYASARPVRPDWDRDRGDARLRQENELLRRDLGLYQQAYAELNDGLDRVERANRRNRDRRSMFMIDRATRDARERAAQYVQPWSYEQEQPDWRDDRDWRTLPQQPMPREPMPTPMPPYAGGSVRDGRTQPPPPVVVTPVTPVTPVRYAMAERDFASLTAQIGRASFADDKLGLVQTAAQTNYFTVAQVVALMKLASFDDTKVEIAVACAPHVVDGDKWFEVYGALSFSSSRDTLRQRVGNR